METIPVKILMCLAIKTLMGLTLAGCSLKDDIFIIEEIEKVAEDVEKKYEK